jgi:2-polyprenyl-3-methyl-5-hydroxy-6-metoxy-1,4-benzoquinol methylase
MAISTPKNRHSSTPALNFRRRETQLPERMDDPACDLSTLHRTYGQFGAVNALVAGWRGVYLRELRPRLPRDRPGTLLDIGCGGGDLARQLSRWAARDGLNLQVTGIDADRRATEYACSQPPRSGVSFRQAYSSDLVAEGKRFDLVISNHLLHHLNAAELNHLLDDSQKLARRAVVHSDIGRSALAYAAFGLLVAPLFRGSFIREDGLISVRRSFTAPELRAVAPLGWDVVQRWPSRTLLLYRAGRA